MKRFANTRRNVTPALALLGAAVVGFLGVAGQAAAADTTATVGRVRVSEARSEEAASYRSALEAFESRLRPSGVKKTADIRILSFRLREGDPGRYSATIYDYSVERAFVVLVDRTGVELERKETELEQDVSDGELADAMKIVTERSSWARGIADGTIDVYPPMPGATKGPDGRRLVNVGIAKASKGRVPRLEGTGLSSASGADALENEVVSVHIPTGEIVRNASGAPPTSMAQLFACGPNSVGCSVATGTCPLIYHIEWPIPNPKWKLDVWHPACTTSIQSQATGIEIQNVYYDGKLILKSADVPVLNVKYDGNTCGPYRDWLYSEYCFQATGVDVPAAGSGFRVTTGNPSPTTLCESGVDGGNFKGVAIHDAGNYLLLTTQTSAGWYRYIMAWRLFLDGSIEPVFGFGATLNSCVCNPHNHHAYWRFEFALDGDPNNPATGISTAERLVPGTTDQWTPVPTEARFIRPAANPTTDWWRVRNPSTGTNYVIKPGGKDGTADADTYAKADYWVLASNANEINDPNTDTSINIDPWINGESIGTTKRLVFWYRAGYRHDVPGGDTSPCELAGPRMEFSQPCGGSITLDKGAYGCSDALNITLKDSDLTGTGTANVTVQSTTETTPETVALTENPPGSGTFTGPFSTTSGPAAPGDAKLSVANGDTVSVRYLDVSFCGTPNVNVEKTTMADCQPPTITNVATSMITESGASITWTTNEPANSGVSYGSSAPPSGRKEDLTSYGTTHALDLTGLSACTSYVFSVDSADIAGNRTTADSGGAYFAFVTRARAYKSGPDDVEGAGSDWTPSGTAGSIWHVDSCKANSPTRAWKAGAPQGTCPGTYGANADTYLVSRALDLGAAGHGYHLRFKELYKTQSGSDLCRPQISVDGGTTWTNLASYSGSNGGWLARDYDLSTFAGSNVLLRFWFHSDASTQDEGWYIDDIDVSRDAACTADLRRVSSDATDACSAGGISSGNAVVEPGEDVALSVTASNFGVQPATGVTATLTSTTPGLTLVRATANLPNIPASGAATTLAPHFAFNVGSGVACGTFIDYTVTFHAAEGSWTSNFSVLVGAGGSGTTTHASADVPKPILDNATATSTLVVPPSGTLNDINVTVNLTHTYDADLTLRLVAPGGQAIVLSNRRGGSGDNFTNTVFDDQASTAIAAGSAPFAGSFIPDESLATLNGLAAGGTWRLEVVDSAASDTGTLVSWSLTIAATTPPVCTACAVGVPAEVPSLAWSATGKSRLDWGGVAGASWYTLHRGTAATLPALVTTADDSCRAWIGTDTSSGETLAAAPPLGDLHWFLVTASSGGGEGPAGSSTGGPRVVNDPGICP